MEKGDAPRCSTVVWGWVGGSDVSGFQCVCVAITHTLDVLPLGPRSGVENEKVSPRGGGGCGGGQ